ncbi:MAG: hypothetical protein IKF90_25275 [Parasporobacterium sp.]|nr:hypothetical protein [Parasporobacterium sp.]
MTTGRKIGNLIIALLMIVGAVLLVLLQEEGLWVVALILCVSLFVYGVRQLIYYITMARHMVGGRMILYMGILIIDAAVFIVSLYGDSQILIMLYLIAAYLVSAVFEILHALEEKKMGAPSWKRTFAFAVGNILIAALCGIFIRSGIVALYIYCGGLVFSAIQRIVNTFRKSEVLYISP